MLRILLSATAALVTLVTVDAVVHVPVYIRVMEVGGIVATVTRGTLKHGVVVRVGVARRAHAVGVAVINRELRVLGVIERRAGPRRRGVARRARSREELRLCRVARIRRVVVIGLVAADTRER